MQTRLLGRNGPSVSALGLGCMGFSGGYGPVDDRESIATVHAALDAGVNYLDTGDFYGAGQNEMLLREALRDKRALLNPVRFPFFSWQLASHKVMRYLSFAPLAVATMSNGLLVSAGWIYGVLAAGHAVAGAEASG